MTDAKIIMRIKAYAKVYDVDLTELDNQDLYMIYRRAAANEWALVEDSILKFKVA